MGYNYQPIPNPPPLFSQFIKHRRKQDEGMRHNLHYSNSMGFMKIHNDTIRNAERDAKIKEREVEAQQRAKQHKIEVKKEKERKAKEPIAKVKKVDKRTKQVELEFKKGKNVNDLLTKLSQS
jgi:hypothetical protein